MKKIKLKNVLLFITLLLMILPTINLINFETPLIYLISPFGVIGLFIMLSGRTRIPTVMKPLTLLWFFIFIQIIIGAFYSTINKLGYFDFPIDIMQYLMRFIFFVSFILIVYKNKLDEDKFIKYFLIVLIMGMAIGILQWIPWPGREFFINLYPYRDGSQQLSQLNRPLYGIRMHGFSQFATANGGIASFAFVYGYSIRKYFNKHSLYSTVLIIFSIINVVASQARAGMLAIVFSMILFYFVNMRYERKTLKPTFKFIIIIILLFATLSYLYYIGNHFVVNNFNRWINLIELGGGARATTQPEYFFNVMKGSDYILGLSKPIINQSLFSYGIEVEPLNIFITYGLIGFILQYSLIVYLLVYFYKRINKSSENKASIALIISSFVGLFSYQVFSVAYFFFREIRVGLFPWVLMGVTIGLYERCRYNKLQDIEQ